MEKSEAKWNAEECSAEVFAESHVVLASKGRIEYLEVPGSALTYQV